MFRLSSTGNCAIFRFALKTTFRPHFLYHKLPSRALSVSPLMLKERESIQESPSIESSSEEDNRSSRQLRAQRISLNFILSSVERLCKAKTTDNIESFLTHRLLSRKFNTSYRATAFSRVISLLLQKHLFDSATSLYNRMVLEGFVPPNTIRVRIQAVSIVQCGLDEKNIQALKALFKDTVFEMEAFSELLHLLLHETETPFHVVNDIAETYFDIRQTIIALAPELVSELVNASLRTGRVDEAQRWLEKFEDSSRMAGRTPDASVYASMIDILGNVDPCNSSTSQAVLQRMKEKGVLPNISIFNSLIRAELVKQCYFEAYTLYRVIMQKRSTKLMPNDETYKMLFRTTKLTSHNRGSRSRKHKRPLNAVAPRQLFHDMLQCHFTQLKECGRSDVVSASSLHIALRTFMMLEDYPAAFTLIHSLQGLGSRPILQTYLIVITNLILRIKRELGHVRQHGEYRLADFLLQMEPGIIGGPHELMQKTEEAQENGRKISLDPATVAQLLRLGEPKRLDESDLGSPPLRCAASHATNSASTSRIHRRSHRMPTLAMLTCEEIIFPTTPFSSVPLARILHKVILASLFKKAMARTDWDWNEAFDLILSSTREEMIPSLPKDLPLTRLSKPNSSKRGDHFVVTSHNSRTIPKS
ncbi:hypothetical protein BJ138DRAFT_1160869 [Hygrophoropsis aurantiaca]|uniref:Uncharacterized protein n=1 Tax=Hygrophoropsis aurantiaca TaxID=72124 RepID=A0ACB8A399_9AGAM|nr:hypothetical protein BJ138DRAFT_1160869 [Hygrophoropsis aurantiaca]